MEKLINEHLENGRSVAVRYRDVTEYDINADYQVIYLEIINPAKETAAMILSELIESSKTTIYSKYTLNEITRTIKKRTKNRDVLIVFNDLQDLSRSSTRFFMDIISEVQILCSIRAETKGYHTKLLNNMKVLSLEEDEVTDIKIPLIIMGGIIAFLLYLKIAMGLKGSIAYLVLASVWFGTIIARTLLWIAS